MPCAKDAAPLSSFPSGKDPFNGMLMVKYLAMIAAWVGEKDLACEQIITVVRSPAGGLDLSYGELKLMPFWDPLRGDPCFGICRLPRSDGNSLQVVHRGGDVLSST